LRYASKNRYELLFQPNTIIQYLTDEHLEYVRDAKTAREMMQSLENVLQQRDLESVGAKMDEDDKVCYLIHTMPDYENVYYKFWKP